MWTLPTDVWKEILVRPQCARALSYTCSAAVAALRGIFTVESSYADVPVTYTVAGRHYTGTFILDEDSVRTPTAEWTSISAEKLPQLQIRVGVRGPLATRVTGDHILVVLDGMVFISTVDQADSLAAVIGVPDMDITKIYAITSIHENFRGAELRGDSRGRHVVILGGDDRSKITRTNMVPASIRGVVVELELVYSENCFCCAVAFCVVA